ncbi:restriction endonuclease [Streptomyces sp. NRRL S-378]|uniref:restriction endonuclease n=1 Tax=Streptomyces sp. NRRL S-378 TaxID=1463904 RepID=UPI001F26FC56|nr:restriction endonuclease [Streptomyces sp. NRRL S-378]
MALAVLVMAVRTAAAAIKALHDAWPVLLAVAMLAGALGAWRVARAVHGRRRDTERLATLRISLAEVDAMDDREFEYALRDLLVRDGWSARRVGGGGDQAADVIQSFLPGTPAPELRRVAAARVRGASPRRAAAGAAPAGQQGRRVLGRAPPSARAAAPQEHGPGSAAPAVVGVPLGRRRLVRCALCGTFGELVLDGGRPDHALARARDHVREVHPGADIPEALRLPTPSRRT